MLGKAIHTCRRFGRFSRTGLKGICGTHSAPLSTYQAPPPIPGSSMTAFQAMNLWRRCFEERGVAEPDQSSQYIVAHLLGAKTIESLGHEKLNKPLSCAKMEQLWELSVKRLSRMPVQYVIEEWDFRDLTLKMRPPVFIPRPETEALKKGPLLRVKGAICKKGTTKSYKELVELVLADLQGKEDTGMHVVPQLTCLEVGCGSGAITLSLLKDLPRLRAIALDQSRHAVDLTRENALRLGLEDRLLIHQVDVLKEPEVLLSLGDSISTLVSNPPYLFSEDMTFLEPELLRFEDHAALDGGEDGLDVIKQILTAAPKMLSIHGHVYLEVDPRHPPLIQQWVKDHVPGLSYLETRHDITNRPRFCILRRER
ncbi:MTRF1L release factor glutamine methyltransferase isoform X2 [Gadus chalcogrammus]|uniref:MTRF1L release factor glutamine methyltransferase isoform X2 n=1 Tax=Gadus chalcogrammus TaxID=1042646 RepID=UPI0024C4E4FE|nr:MTRF1L release factor glutamine methyltransferase isoform X2 [Gadus chalcogrammus]